MPARQARQMIGLMSGTSCDGVDAVLVEILGRADNMQVRLLAHRHQGYPARLRRRLLSVMAPSTTTTQELCDLNVTVAEQFASAAVELMRTTHCKGSLVQAVGSHGQTICHLPDSPVRSTLQIGEPAVIAHRTGIVTVGDFRVADVAVGGQGAPLVPYVDFLLFRDESKTRAMQNIGGISNATILPAGGSLEDICIGSKKRD